mmetsp:Transcript_2309/g.3858  ORF Transcript_2309/g.3858 Transcript_2309/m.3858 type:complete len:159 (+) Transcript_2309:31-507(+)
MNNSESCAERAVAAAGAGACIGALVGTAVSAFKTPQVLDGPEGVKQVRGAGAAAAAAMPKLTRLVGGNALLFSAVGVSYSMSKCIAEGMMGDRHPLCSAMGGVAAGVALGVHTKNLTVMMGAAAGLGMISLASDFNGPALLQDPARYLERSSGLRTPK